MKLQTSTMLWAALGVAAVGALGLWVWSRGGVRNAATAAGAAIVGAADGAISGGVGAAGQVVGLPTPDQVTTDPAEARWLIDNAGHFEASKWSSATAYMRALLMPSGTGSRPAASSAVGRAFAAVATDTGDEADRLARRYPMPSDYSGAARIIDNAAGDVPFPVWVGA